MFTLVLLLVVLASMRGSFRAVWLPPGLDAYWYAYQETGDLHRANRPSVVMAKFLEKTVDDLHRGFLRFGKENPHEARSFIDDEEIG